ncbi:acylneuraminate cytidylyltransferase family protein [Pseudothauera lacus]|uniref:Acylneuraminate cytidylyltransferase family protein n=1 Tax=Pseudothauera lacus TaxID=2136175 RepID=A0A2T4ICK9_9RHOO|nr:acylneuraminate cytidylyltransferase family protein [Pseudothauera lacus]
MERVVNQRIAIILARGGSKRLPRKNVIDFFGKPMLAWSVEAALESGAFQEVLVSTDAPEIAELAVRYGASAPFLRDQAADDHATSSQATIVALSQAEQHWGKRYATVAQFMANCPMRTADDVRAAIDAFDQSSASAQISCFRFGWMNPWWAAKVGPDGQPVAMFPEALSARSQDLPPLYCPSGALWLARRDSLLAAGSFYAPGHVFHELSWVSAMDIDDKEDLQMAKASFLVRNERSI